MADVAQHGPKVNDAVAKLNRAAEQLVRFTPNDARWELFDRRVEQLIAAVKQEAATNG